MSLIEKIPALSRYLVKRFMREGFVYRASGLTVSTLLGIVPFSAILFSFMSLFPSMAKMGKSLQGMFYDNFVPAHSDMIQKYISQFATQATKLPAMGFVFLFLIAIMLLVTIEKAFNDIWQLTKGRRGVSAFVTYWAVLSLAPLFAGFGLAASSYLLSLRILSGTMDSLGVTQWILAILPFLFNICAFTVLYVVVPNCKVRLRHGVVGGVIAALLFEGAKKGFVLYLTHIPTYTLLYGTLATFPIFLIWLYLSWVIVLFGAMITQTIATSYLHNRGKKLDGFTMAFFWLYTLWKSHEGMSVEHLCRRVPYNYEVPPMQVLEALVDAKFVVCTREGKYVLTADYGAISLYDLLRSLPYALPSPEKVDFVESPLIQSLISSLHAADQDLQEALSAPLIQLVQ